MLTKQTGNNSSLLGMSCVKCSPLSLGRVTLLILPGWILPLQTACCHGSCGISLKSGKDTPESRVRLGFFILVCGKVTQLFSCFAPGRLGGGGEGGHTAGTDIKTREGRRVGF